MALLKILKRIHKQVHDAITFVSDHRNPNHPGVLDQWDGPRVNGRPAIEWDGFAKFSGDCDDFACACYILCEREGLKPRLIACHVPSDAIRGGEGGNHLVCSVDGNILDNLQPPGTVPGNHDLTGYRWQAASTDGLAWKKILESK